MDVALIHIRAWAGELMFTRSPAKGRRSISICRCRPRCKTVLLVETTAQTVAFPERMVIEAATVPRNAIQHVNGQPAILMHDRFLPLFRLVDLHAPARWA